MSGLSKGLADRSLIVPPKFGGKFISSTFEMQITTTYVRSD